MSTNTTEIAFILDRSGSMESIQTGTLEGVNAFITQQKEESEEYPVLFSLTFFNTDVEVRTASLPMKEVELLDEKTYLPRGGTALLDAIGITIDGLGKRLAETPENERPDKVIVAIMTDGEENSSRIFNWTEISDKIKHQTDVYKWEFLFMGANQDAIATASKMNIHHDSSVTYFQQDGSARTTLRAMSTSIQRSTNRSKPNWTKPSLAATVAEEEAKERDAALEAEKGA